MDDGPIVRTYSVAEVAGLIGRVVHQAFPGHLWIRGQVRNLQRAPTGHVYFDLVDPGQASGRAEAVLPVALLAADKAGVNAVMRTAGAGRMDDGVEIRLQGQMSWFAPRAKLQLRMIGIDPEYTLGRLAEDRTRLLGRLEAEGLLDRNRSVPMPVLPLRIGLVTSLGSAAHADFHDELVRSGFGFQVVEIDTRTQGADAVRSVAAAIGAALAAGVDLVAVVRGGGARTDLAAYDDEPIARAIATATVPVFTGIGHEIDRSIADEVAHTAHKTPTACAAAIVAAVSAAQARAEALWAAVARLAGDRLDLADQRVRTSAGRTARASAGGLAAGQRGLDDARRRLVREAERALSMAADRVDRDEARAAVLDPVRAMARGWSITRTADGGVLRSITDAPAGTVLVTALADGTVTSTVGEPAGAAT